MAGSTPRPIQRPIMALLDLIGRRWALRVLWELRRAPLSFRALRSACDDISPTVLNTRLAELRDAGIVMLSDEGYGFTPAGRELAAQLGGLNEWANAWKAAQASSSTSQ